jgi:hypothetical protein
MFVWVPCIPYVNLTLLCGSAERMSISTHNIRTAQHRLFKTSNLDKMRRAQVRRYSGEHKKHTISDKYLYLHIGFIKSVARKRESVESVQVCNR